MKHAILALLLIAALGLHALDILPGNFFRIDNLPDIPDKNVFMELRGHKTIYLTPDARGLLSVELTCAQIGKYTPSLSYALYSPQGEQLQSGEIPVKSSITLKAEKLLQGIYRLELDSHNNAALVKHPSSACCVVATQTTPLNLIYHCPRLYFMTSNQNANLQLALKGSAPNEHVAITITDASNTIVFEGNTVNRKGTLLDIDIPVPQEQKGAIWSLRLSPVPGQGFEDMQLVVKGGAEPVFAMSPAQLVFPVYAHVAFTQPDKRHFQGISLSSLFLRQTDNYQCSVNFQPSVGRPADDILLQASREKGLYGFTYGQDAVLAGTFSMALTVDGKLAISETVPIIACDGNTFHEIPWNEKDNVAPVTEEEKAIGFQFFQRAEPGFVRPTAKPQADEITKLVVAETSAGLQSTEYFALHPLKAFKNTKLTIGSLVGPGTIPDSAVQIRVANTWLQRTDWNSKTVINAPELLELKDSVDLMPSVPQLFSIHADVPPTAKPGVYNAKILFNGTPCAIYQLIIDDFALPEAPSMTFGLYADGGRWFHHQFTDEEILREMKDFRAHGINALMLYPLSGASMTYDGVNFNINMNAFRHQMKLYNQVGFPGVAVLSLQDINPFLKKGMNVTTAEHTPEFVAGFKAVLETLRQMGIEDNWPAYCVHTVDEPNTGRNAEEAVRTLKLVKETGFKTFNTCYGNFVRSHLAPWLDYRCYNNIAFGSSRTKEANDALLKETLADGDQFWWYGSGCYTNGGLMQDCNLYSNRHMLGIFNWRSRATGAWTWTFLRIKGKPYNDLDGNNYGEAKEACICYPMPDNHGLIPTIQWEAIREGIYDYRYIALWDTLCKQAKANPAKAARAQQSEETIGKVMDSISWNCLNFSVGNAQLQQLRTALIKEIKALK